MAAKTVAQRIFAVRSFKGASQAQLRERLALVGGLVRDVAQGRLSESTAKGLAREISDRILAGGPLAAGPRIPPARISRALLALFGKNHGTWRHELASRQFGRTRRRV